MMMKITMRNFLRNASRHILSFMGALSLAQIAHAESVDHAVAAVKTVTTPTMVGAYGDWVPPDGDAIIRVQACDGQSRNLCARLVKHAYENLSESDALNPDHALRERPLIGVEILNQVKFSKANQWRGGDLYDPRTGKSYFAKVRLLNDHQLKITGCIGPGLCKGYIWMRASENTVLKEGSIFSKTGIEYERKLSEQNSSDTSED